MTKAVLVISYDQPAATHEAIERLTITAEKVRALFTDEPDLQVHVAIRESADAVLEVFGVR